MSDYRGSTRRLGDQTITTELRMDGSWLAFLNGDRRQYETRDTEAAAIGEVVIARAVTVPDEDTPIYDAEVIDGAVALLAVGPVFEDGELVRSLRRALAAETPGGPWSPRRVRDAARWWPSADALVAELDRLVATRGS